MNEVEGVQSLRQKAEEGLMEEKAVEEGEEERPEGKKRRLFRRMCMCNHWGFRLCGRLQVSA